MKDIKQAANKYKPLDIAPIGQLSLIADSENMLDI